MPAGVVSVTVTAKIGPGNSVTSLALTDVASVNFRFKDGVVEVVKDGGPTTSFEYSDIATVTITPAAKTVTLSTT
jgi:hypothetical protein